MKYKIGVFGSAAGDLSKIIPKARELGEKLASHNITIITGACAGLPFETANTAYKLGAEIWGYSSAVDFESQNKIVETDNSIYKKLIYIPAGYEFVSNDLVTRKYRNVTSTATCDAGIIISGRWGTLNEFTNLYDMDKVIGIYTGTGGIADQLDNLHKKIYKPGKAVLIFDSDPEQLIDKVLAQLDQNKYTRT